MTDKFPFITSEADRIDGTDKFRVTRVPLPELDEPVLFHFGPFMLTLHNDGCSLIVDEKMRKIVLGFTGDHDRIIGLWPGQAMDQALVERIKTESLRFIPKEKVEPVQG